MNKKRIDYDTVKRVMALNLSERKSVEMLNGMGIKISNGAYHKYKSEQLLCREILPTPNTKMSTSNDSNQIDPINTKVSTSINGEKIDSIDKMSTSQNDVAGVIINELDKMSTSNDSNQIDPINTKMSTSNDTAKNDSIGKVSTSDNGEKIDTIIVEYGIYKLKAISHEHRDYRRCGLSKKNLYEVLQIEELRDYQFDDLFQLRMAKINPRLVYNWKYGRCINDYDKPLN